MARDALRYYPELTPAEMHWVLVEATQRILPEVGPRHGRVHRAGQLDARGIDIRLGTRLESCVDGVVKLSDGDSFRADTIVWTAGVKPSPMLDDTDLPRDDAGPDHLPAHAAGGRRRRASSRAPGAPATAPPCPT